MIFHHIKILYRIITTIIIHNIANRHIEMADIIIEIKKALERGLFCVRNRFPYAIWLLTHSASLDFVMAPEWVATA